MKPCITELKVKPCSRIFDMILEFHQVGPIMEIKLSLKDPKTILSVYTNNMISLRDETQFNIVA